MSESGRRLLEKYQPTAADPLCANCEAPRHDHKANGQAAKPELDCPGYVEDSSSIPASKKKR